MRPEDLETRTENLPAVNATPDEYRKFELIIQKIGFEMPSKFWRWNIEMLIEQAGAGEDIALPLSYALDEIPQRPVKPSKSKTPRSVSKATCRVTLTEEAKLMTITKGLGFADLIDYVRRVLVTLLEQVEAEQKIHLPLRYALRLPLTTLVAQDSKPNSVAKKKKSKPSPKRPRSKQSQKAGD